MKSSSGTSGALTARAKAARSVSIWEVFSKGFLLRWGGGGGGLTIGVGEVGIDVR